MNEVIKKAQLAKQASYQLNHLTTAQKNEALQYIAEALCHQQSYLLQENEKDIASGAQLGLDQAVLDRILLTKERIQAMSEAIALLITLPDPVGEILEEITKENGLHIRKKRVPLGVIGMIYEARPNVTIDAATLAIKTSNAVVLRGSSSAKHSNIALVNIIHDALQQSAVPVNSVQLIEDTSRETAASLFTLTEYLDVLIPRGGKKLIELVVREATVPVLETGAGNCHIFLDDSADVHMATTIIINAKTQRPSVCNALESLLLSKTFLANNGKQVLTALANQGVTIIADKHVQPYFPTAQIATSKDFTTEYLDETVSVQVVENVEQAVMIINANSTHHSEAIITQNQRHADYFLQHVDSAAVYHNASTRFTDGFEFGYGAEIGISTQKLHARGPMGLPALTTTKYMITGSGQIRS